MKGLSRHCLIVAATLALMSAATTPRAEDAAGRSPSGSSPAAAGKDPAEMLFPLAVQTLPDGSRRTDIQSLPVPLGLAIIDLTRRVDSLEAELKAIKEKAR